MLSSRNEMARSMRENIKTRYALDLLDGGTFDEFRHLVLDTIVDPVIGNMHAELKQHRDAPSEKQLSLLVEDTHAYLSGMHPRCAITSSTYALPYLEPNLDLSDHDDEIGWPGLAVGLKSLRKETKGSYGRVVRATIMDPLVLRSLPNLERADRTTERQMVILIDELLDFIDSGDACDSLLNHPLSKEHISLL